MLGLLGGLGLGLAAKGLLDRGNPADIWRDWLTASHPPEALSLPSASTRARVAVGYIPGATGYDADFPFDPVERYPEYPHAEQVAGLPNQAYSLLREALRTWHPEGFGEDGWNPLEGTIRPGDTVAIKPNLVWEPGWDEKRLGLNATHPSTLRAVVDYVFKACGATGRILICEGTATASQWPQVVRVARLDELANHLRRDHGVPVEIVNLNDVPREKALLVQLRERSMLAPLAGRTFFDLHNQPDSHTRRFGLGSYYVAPQPLEADAVISLAQMKIHRATGVTLAMKNLFGIIPSWDGPYGDNILKDVPHYTDIEAAGGPRTLYLENDTTWRTAVDLNHILLYADARGGLQERRQRRYLAIVDGLVAAGRDMFNPDPLPLGTLVVGDEPVSVDTVASRIMGFDPRKVRSVAWALGAVDPDLGPAAPSAIDVQVGGAGDLSEVSDGSRIVTPEMQAYPWRGHLEADDFAPPEVVQLRVASGQVQAVLRDRSGVAFARLVGARGGQPVALELQLADGTPHEGEWRGQLPLGFPAPESLTLEAGDFLLNVHRETASP